MTYTYEYTSIRICRLGANLTIKEAAEEYGCKYQQWQSWESGQKIPSAVALAKIANILHCEIDCLIMPAEEYKSKTVDQCEQLEIEDINIYPDYVNQAYEQLCGEYKKSFLMTLTKERVKWLTDL